MKLQRSMAKKFASQLKHVEDVMHVQKSKFCKNEGKQYHLHSQAECQNTLVVRCKTFRLKHHIMQN